jgi:polyisoprenoid-binding protein YceI
MKYILKFIGIVFLLSFYSHAFSYNWEVDPAHSEVRFQVKHIHTTVSGQFKDFSGNLFFNPNNLKSAKINFTIKVKSVDTNNGKRDIHLKSKDFLNVNKFPTIGFRSTEVTRIGKDLFVAEGELTIKDVTKKIRLKFNFYKEKPHPFKRNEVVAGFKSSIVIPRLDYNVGNGKFLKLGVVGKDVIIDIVMEALRDVK